MFHLCISASSTAECTGDSEWGAEDARVEGENFEVNIAWAEERKPKTMRRGTVMLPPEVQAQ